MTDKAAFDPAEHSVSEVQAHLDGADPAERDRVLAAEAAGKARKTLLAPRAADPETDTAAAVSAAQAAGLRPEDVVPALNSQPPDPLAGYVPPAKIEDGVEWLAPTDGEGNVLVDVTTGQPLR